MKQCPNCGSELPAKIKETKRESQTTNPYKHPFPHHRCVNVQLTPRLIGPQKWRPKMVGD